MEAFPAILLPVGSKMKRFGTKPGFLPICYINLYLLWNTVLHDTTSLNIIIIIIKLIIFIMIIVGNGLLLFINLHFRNDFRCDPQAWRRRESRRFCEGHAQRVPNLRPPNICQNQMLFLLQGSGNSPNHDNSNLLVCRCLYLRNSWKCYPGSIECTFHPRKTRRLRHSHNHCSSSCDFLRARVFKKSAVSIRFTHLLYTPCISMISPYTWLVPYYSPENGIIRLEDAVKIAVRFSVSACKKWPKDDDLRFSFRCSPYVYNPPYNIPYRSVPPGGRDL